MIVLCLGAAKQGQVLVRVFHLPHCKACIKVINDVLPPIAEKYGDKVQWEYFDISERASYEQFLQLEQSVGRQLATPTILIGNKVMVGVTETADHLDEFIGEELAASQKKVVPLEGQGVNLLERFRSFGPLAVIGAGLVDGVNPCAFTVIVFFVSFLTFMGYRRRELVLISLAYIFAVFLTYLSLGFGLFRVLYSLKAFYILAKAIYLVIGALSLFLGCVAMNDYFLYKRTGRTEGLALQLPKPVKDKIHSIVGAYYRKDKNAQPRAPLGLFLSAFAVGFLVSLLEAVCTGQLYLPTIVFVLKEGSLRIRALFYLIVYNIMFILPLVAVFLFAFAGVTSKQFEAFTRRNIALIKIAMAAVFFALGIVLWVGI